MVANNVCDIACILGSLNLGGCAADGEARKRQELPVERFGCDGGRLNEKQREHEPRIRHWQRC